MLALQIRSVLAEMPEEDDTDISTESDDSDQTLDSDIEMYEQVVQLEEKIECALGYIKESKTYDPSVYAYLQSVTTKFVPALATEGYQVDIPNNVLTRKGQIVALEGLLRPLRRFIANKIGALTSRMFAKLQAMKLQSRALRRELESKDSVELNVFGQKFSTGGPLKNRALRANDAPHVARLLGQKQYRKVLSEMDKVTGELSKATKGTVEYNNLLKKKSALRLQYTKLKQLAKKTSPEELKKFDLGDFLAELRRIENIEPRGIKSTEHFKFLSSMWSWIKGFFSKSTRTSTNAASASA